MPDAVLCGIWTDPGSWEGENVHIFNNTSLYLINMNKLATRVTRGLNFLTSTKFSTESENISFLKMVESYFDKAGKHTSIRADKLNFYKKPDNVVKFTLTLTRGREWFM